MANVWSQLADSVDKSEKPKRALSEALAAALASGYQLVPSPAAVLHDFKVGELVDIVSPEWVKKLTLAAAAQKPVLEALMQSLEMDVPTRGTIIALLTRNEVLVRSGEGRVWVQRVLGGLRPASGAPLLTRVVLSVDSFVEAEA